MEKKNIIFVSPYPFDEAPSQRFRYEQYLSTLEKEGYSYQLAPFLNIKAWNILYKSGNNLKKTFWLLLSFSKRLVLLFQLAPYEYIFIHREAMPFGPPIFEWIVRFFWKKKIIYDFDDAIWLEDPNEKGSLKALIKWKSKVKRICKWSHIVSCGNEYLAKFAREYNTQVIINPTTIDTDYHQEIKPKEEQEIITIGWTGTHSTLPYLSLLLPVLTRLSAKYKFELLVISNQMPDFDVSYARFIPWNKATEIEDLNQIDIGIMPLTDDIWSQGKCGFKLLQYMAINKPIIASAVGINEKLIVESGAGFEAGKDEEWEDNISNLLKDDKLRNELGMKGRKYIEDFYSVNSNKNTFLSLFD